MTEIKKERFGTSRITAILKQKGNIADFSPYEQIAVFSIKCLSIYLRLRRKMLVEDLIDLEVRMTMRTRTFPITPTARTRLGEERQWWW